MSPCPLPVLDYAGPMVRIRRSWPRTGLGIVVGLVKSAWMLLRLALLTAGFILLGVSALLLMAGGKRSAARAVRSFVARGIDLLRLWRDDMLRPFRQWAMRRGSFPMTTP